MADFYAEMQSVATDLLTQFKQGVITLTRTTHDAPTNAWDAPTVPVETVYTLNATARGVSQKYVDGTNVLRTDGQVTMAVQATDVSGGVVSLTPDKTSDVLKIDGKKVTVLEIMPLPLAGTPAAYVIIFRG